MLATIRIALALVFIVLVSVILFPIHGLLLALKHPWRTRLPRFWHKAALFALGVRVKVRGTIERRRPLLVVSNHTSWLDILVLASVADVTYVAKAEVADWPVFGWLARLQRTIFVEREQRRRSHDQANDMADRLNAGEAVVLFPEGTTSDGNRLLATKSSLYGAATAAAKQSRDGRVYVQPTAIAYTRVHGMPMGHYHRPIAAWPGDTELVPHLLQVMKISAIDVEVNFGSAIEVTSETNRKVLAGTAENEIRRMMEECLRQR